VSIAILMASFVSASLIDFTPEAAAVSTLYNSERKATMGSSSEALRAG